MVNMILLLLTVGHRAPYPPLSSSSKCEQSRWQRHHNNTVAFLPFCVYITVLLRSHTQYSAHIYNSSQTDGQADKHARRSCIPAHPRAPTPVACIWHVISVFHVVFCMKLLCFSNEKETIRMSSVQHDCCCCVHCCRSSKVCLAFVLN